MGEQDLPTEQSAHELRTFMKALLADVHALERMLEGGQFESGVRRIGAEQEMFLIDPTGRPVPAALQILDKLGKHPQFVTELAQFNLEANLSPRAFSGDCLSQMEAELRQLLDLALEAAQSCGARILLTGILPSLRIEDLTLDNMTPSGRYRTLSAAIRRLRGGVFRFRIKGPDELDLTHDNVMLESANTSFQLHLQVGPEEFAPLYNLAQVIAAPLLAAAVNSPLLVGRRLWQETRVALFQQSVDARSDAHQARGNRPRVSFGDKWVNESVLEIYRDDIARFRLLIATEIDEDPDAVLARGKVPMLKALRLHNGTIYRWNRACYGVADGVAHLRIEARAMPAGPTVIDEMANAALFFGLMTALSEEYPDVRQVMRFDDASANFTAAARLGLQAQLTWFHGREVPVKQLLLDELVPSARAGLRKVGIKSADVDCYLGVIEQRVASGQTGAQWLLRSFQATEGHGNLDHRLRTLSLATLKRQRTSEPVHAWPIATMAEADSWRHSFQKVGQFMTTDLFTVRPEDVVDLAASVMEWKHVRHVPVEDDEGRLVGLVSHRALLRLVGRGLNDRNAEPVPVRAIMKPNPVTVTPDTPTLRAITLMRENRVGCLPVVQQGRLVGIITERDLINVAAQLFEQNLREAAPS
jgi:CBS domain-containing protein/gamma-glutamyl:cysteine ligase YbdK (ATP-grasp superfamily)